MGSSSHIQLQIPLRVFLAGGRKSAESQENATSPILTFGQKANFRIRPPTLTITENALTCRFAENTSVYMGSSPHMHIRKSLRPH